MLDNPKLRKVASLGTAAIGLATLVSPKRAAILGDKLNLATRYENVSDADIEPRDWYVDATRASGAGMVAAGLTGFLLATRDDVPADDETAIDADADADADEEADADDAVDVVETASDDADDGPVEIDLDDADDPDDD